MDYRKVLYAVCAGNAIYFDNVRGGEYGDESFGTEIESPSVAYLRLRREGNIYTGQYSKDGENWVTIGQHTGEIESPKIGLIAHQSYVDGVPADFQYFTVKELP